MIKEKYRSYLNWGITVFLIIVSAILTFFIVYRFEDLCQTLSSYLSILAPIISGIVIAYLLSPVRDRIVWLMDLIPGKHGKFRRRATYAFAIFLSILLMIAVIALMIGTVLPQVIDTLRILVQSADQYATSLDTLVAPLEEINSEVYATIMDIIRQTEASVREFLQNDIMQLVSTLTSSMMQVGRFIYNFLLGMIVSVYLMAAQNTLVGRMKKLLYAFIKPQTANAILDVAQQTNRMFKGFIVGKIVDSSIIGVLCFLGMSVLKMPYALFISVLVGVTNVIPYFGPFLGAIPSALILVIDNPTKALIFLVFIVVLQQIDGNIIGPKVLGNSTGLSSLGVLISILVGGGLFGLVGMMISVPVCGVLYSIFKRITDSKLKKRGLPTHTQLYAEMQGVNEQTGKMKT